MCLERPIKNPETVEQAFLSNDSPRQDDEAFRRSIACAFAHARPVGDSSTRDESNDGRQWPLDR